jgi:transcription elongation factor Elf1
MFLYQSENDSHFECPQCGQHGTVPTAHLDAVLQRNEHAVISCTKCMTRFAPHAPTAGRLQVTEAVHDEDIGMPQMALEEAGDEGSDDEARARSDKALPELHEHWQRHQKDARALPPLPEAESETAKGALPIWLQPHNNKKD